MTDQTLPEVRYSISFPDGPETEWLVVSFTCHEELSGGCNMVLDLASDDANVELSEFLGSTCELCLARDEDHSQHVYGVVVRVDLVGRVDGKLVIRVHTSSAFELGRQGRNSRIWQAVSPMVVVAEVLDGLLGAYGRSFNADSVLRGQDPRIYCVQYKESDFDFVRRLLEEEGISYCFTHDANAGHEVLTLFDSNEQCPAVEGLHGSSLVPLISHSPDQATFESLQELEWSQQLTTTAVLRRDYDWQQPSDLLTTAAGGPDDRGRIRRVYAHLRRRFEDDDLEERAQDLAHAHALAGSVARGRGNALGMRPGVRFGTDAHSADGAPEEYIVTKITHRGSDSAASNYALGTVEVVYANNFECVAADREIRPLPRTPKPDVRGAQTATVVGEGEIYTDEHGRIQVQFHWEEAPSYAAGASCWVRCAQSWSGLGWGAQFIPRVGMEVVVEFVEGNPDRPLVVGCVYNGENGYPFELPARSTQSGWRTNSSPGGDGSNELRFDDAAGNEEIYIHGQKDWNVAINHNTSRATGNDEFHNVGHDLSKSVSNNQSEVVGVDKAICVGNDHDESIGDNMTLAVGNNQSISIGNNQTIEVASNLDETIGKSATQKVAIAKTTMVGAANTILVGAAMTTTVGAALSEQVVGAKNVSVGLMCTETVGGARTLTADSITNTASKAITSQAGTDFTVKATKTLGLNSDLDVLASGTNSVTIDAGAELTIKCGLASLSMKAAGVITLTGSSVTINGTEKVALKGAQITEN